MANIRINASIAYTFVKSSKPPNISEIKNNNNNFATPPPKKKRKSDWNDVDHPPDLMKMLTPPKKIHHSYTSPLLMFLAKNLNVHIEKIKI